MPTSKPKVVSDKDESSPAKAATATRKSKVTFKEPAPPPSTVPAPSSSASGSVPPATDEANMALNSFESVMAAMDEELVRHRKASQPSSEPKASSDTKIATPAVKQPKPSDNATKNGKGQAPPPLPKLPTEADLDDLDEDELEAMDRELKAALKSAGYNSEEEEDEDGDDGVEEARELDGEDRREYRMMKDFLESYKSQGGESGVVGNLFGRLGK